MELTTDSIKDQLPFYLTQPAKEELVKALNAFPKHFNYYTPLKFNGMLQGDGWSSLEVANFEAQENKFIKGIILSNSCDIDSANPRQYPAYISFAPIIKLDTYKSHVEKILDTKQVNNKIEAIKTQSVSNIFYLPDISGYNYIALLDNIHSIPIIKFEKVKDKQKLFTLSQAGFYLFLFKLSVHFCRFHEGIDRSKSELS